MKHILKFIMPLILIFSFSWQINIFATSEMNFESATVIFEDDFSVEKTYSAINVVYTEEYGIGNPAPSVHLKKTANNNPRLTQNSSLHSSGIYVVEFDFMKPDTTDCASFMEITDKDGAHDAFYMSVKNGDITLVCWDLSGASQTITLVDEFVANKWYNISLSINLDNKTVKIYIDDWRVARGTICAINPSVTSIGRFIDSRCNGEYYLDNILVYEDLIAEELDFDDIINPQKSINLPSVGKSGGVVEWSSSNKEILSDSGEILSTPLYTTDVVMTAAIKKGNTIQNRDYIVRIDGSDFKVESTQIIQKEVLIGESNILPSSVTATLSDGSIISLPVEWKNEIDRNIIDEQQEIRGIVESGAATALARITILGSLNICQINYSDGNGNSTLRMVNCGKIDSVIAFKGTSVIEANLVISIMDAEGNVADKVVVVLNTINDWQLGTIKKIPVNHSITLDNPQDYTIKADIVDDDGNLLCQTFESGTSVPSRIYIAGDSTIAKTANQYEAGSADTLGWGDVISQFFDDEITCYNFTNTQSPITSYSSMERIMAGAGCDDYIIFNFGHTNSDLINEAYYPNAEKFEEKLRSFIVSAYIKGITPLIATPCVSQKSIIDLQQKYTDAVNKIASDYGMPLLDLASIIPQHFSSLDFECYTDTSMAYLTRRGATQVAVNIAQLFDKLEAPAQSYMRYDVVTCFATGEDISPYFYVIDSVHLLNADGESVNALVDGGKIDSVNIKSLFDSTKKAKLFVTVFQGEELKIVKTAELSDDVVWARNDNRKINIDMQLYLKDVLIDECSVRVFIFDDNLLSCCDVFEWSD